MTLIDQLRQRAASRTPAETAQASRRDATFEADQKQAAFEARHPDIAAWWKNNGGEFAMSLRDRVRQGRMLTEPQLAAAQRSAAKLTQRVEQAKPVDATGLQEVFARAKSNGVKSPRLRIGVMTFSPAKADSANAGAIYVKQRDTGEYLGKVMGGKFLRSALCDFERESVVLDAMANPVEAAVRHGKVTGECSICGRELTDADSIARGIGPICAAKWGF